MQEPIVAPEFDAATAALKVPPHSLEAEQAVLGGLMLDNGAWDRVADLVTEVDFYRRDHRLIFTAIKKLSERDSPFDVVTLAEWLDANGELDNIGGPAYLASLANNTPSAANIKSYAAIVRERSVLRQLISIANEVADSAFNPNGRTVQELLDDAEKRVFEIADQSARSRKGFVAMRDLLVAAVDKIDQLFQRDEAITGIPSGFADFDEKTSGLQRSDLIIVAGRPSMGKCVEAGTELVLEDGRVETIEAIYRRRQARLLTLDGALQLQFTSPSAYVDDGLKPVFRVTTRLGRSVATTASHPFLTTAGWRPLAELSVGEAIALPQRLPVFGRQPMRECEITLLACLCGGGVVTDRQYGLRHAAPPVQHAFREAAQAFGGLQVIHHQHGREGVPELWLEPVAARPAAPQRWQPAARGPAAAVAVAIEHYLDEAVEPAPREGWGEWLERLEIGAVGGPEARLPAPLFQLPEPQLALLLNRLWACAGEVAVERAEIALTTPSEPLAGQIQHLLLRFGVVAARWPAAGQWRITLREARSLRRFAESINILGQEAAVAQAVASAEGAASPWREAGDILWDEISAIEPLGLRQVYDLTVPESHNFIANDICVHNTTFAMNIAENAAIRSKVPVAVFSMEMPGEQLAMRMMSSLGRIDQHRVRTGKLDDDDWPRLTSAVSILAETKIFIDDTPALTPTDLRARARRLAREHPEGLGLIVIDYLQLMQVAGGARENRATEISEISRSLKALAKELRCPVVALSQLNRSLEQRPNKRPVMSDLRESGAIEQDADIIIFIYRDEVYNPDSPDKGTAEIIIGKQRNGPIGTVRVTFLGQFTRFENFAPGAYGGGEYE